MGTVAALPRRGVAAKLRLRRARWAGALLLLAAGGAAAELGDGDVVLSLAGGAKVGMEAEGTGRPQQMELEFSCRAGDWGKEVWGFAPGFNGAEHRGQAADFRRQGDTLQLVVKLEITGNSQAPGGTAEYRLELRREGDGFSGRYSGAFVGRKVEGAVEGRISESVARSAANFKALGAQEHPRLIFRPGDLAELKRRMETPEGRAIAAMLQTAPVRGVEQVDDRRSSWIAANWGVLHHLAGDKSAAEKARRILVEEVIRKPMPIDRAEIHLAFRLLGVALAYDLCYDAWDEEFRGLLAEYLHYSMLELRQGLHQGLLQEDIRLDPWNHRNAIRVSVAGLAAIALLGETGLDGAMDAEARKTIESARRGVLRYLRLGLGPQGWCVEGDFYKKFALANGLLQFLHAGRVALGQDLSRASPALLAGYLPAADPLKQNLSGVGVRAVQASGIWAMGLGSVPSEHLPPLKWCFDREAGLSGAKHFDCTYPYQGAYALMNYPFGVEGRHPGQSLPWTQAEVQRGRFLFRNEWKDGDDFLVMLNLRSGAWPRIERNYTGRPFEVQLAGLGRKWLAAPFGFQERNSFFGAELLLFETPRPKQAVLAAVMDKAFHVPARPPAHRRKSGGEPEPEEKPNLLWGADLPLAAGNLKVRRAFAVDLSGASGAPALFALVDQVEGAAAFKGAWELPFKDAVLSGNSFSVGEAEGPNLKGLLVTPSGARSARLPSAAEYFLLFTVQKGAAPAMKIEGTGLKSRVSAGGQTVSFDGLKLRFEK